ncbi:MAG TPA: hypothetical protein VGR40_07305 [Candidatus Binatus sp.]|nr:hypothetical protein [Candidatus Binatus sp.]
MDHAIDCRIVHAQYFGDLADGENIVEWDLSYPRSFQDFHRPWML